MIHQDFADRLAAEHALARETARALVKAVLVEVAADFARAGEALDPADEHLAMACRVLVQRLGYAAERTLPCGVTQ